MFSIQIMNMLDNAERDGVSDIVSWRNEEEFRKENVGGGEFIIRDKKRFKEEILPRYFKNIKFPSFTKHMRRWGFKVTGTSRIHNTASYWHPLFIRGDLNSCRKMGSVHRSPKPNSTEFLSPVLQAESSIARRCIKAQNNQAIAMKPNLSLQKYLGSSFNSCPSSLALARLAASSGLSSNPPPLVFQALEQSVNFPVSRSPTGIELNNMMYNHVQTSDLYNEIMLRNNYIQEQQSRLDNIVNTTKINRALALRMELSRLSNQNNSQYLPFGAL